MPDKSYTIRIVTVADGAGTRESVDGLERTTRATERATEATKEHGHSFFHAESEGRSFHKLLHAISSESPIIGEALRAALNPVTGIIMGGVMALEYFKRKQEEAIKAAEEAAGVARKEMIGAWDAITKSEQDAIAAVTTYKEALGEAAKKGDGIAQQLEKRLAISKALGGTDQDALKLKQSALEQERKALDQANEKAKAATAEFGAFTKDRGRITRAEWAQQHGGDLDKAVGAQQKSMRESAVSFKDFLRDAFFGGPGMEEERAASARDIDAKNAAVIAAKKAHQQNERAVAEDEAHRKQLQKAQQEQIDAINQHATAVRKLAIETETMGAVLNAERMRKMLDGLERAFGSLGLNLGPTNKIIEERMRGLLTNPT